MTAFNLTELLYVDQYNDSAEKVFKRLNYNLYKSIISIVGGYELAKKEFIQFLNFEGNMDLEDLTTEEEFIQGQLFYLVGDYILSNTDMPKLDNRHNHIVDIMVANTYYDCSKDNLVSIYHQLYHHNNSIIRELFEGTGLFLGMNNAKATIQIVEVNQDKFCREYASAVAGRASMFACSKQFNHIAHELTHLFMGLLFKNGEKPFSDNQTSNVMQIEFHQAIIECVKKISYSKIIDFGFNMDDYNDYQSVNSLINSASSRTNIHNAMEAEGASETTKTFIERFSYAVNRYNNQTSESEFIAIYVELLAQNIDEELADLLTPISNYWSNHISPIINAFKIQNQEHCKALQNSCMLAGEVCSNTLNPFYHCIDLFH